MPLAIAASLLSLASLLPTTAVALEAHPAPNLGSAAADDPRYVRLPYLTEERVAPTTSAENTWKTSDLRSETQLVLGGRVASSPHAAATAAAPARSVAARPSLLPTQNVVAVPPRAARVVAPLGSSARAAPAAVPVVSPARPVPPASASSVARPPAVVVAPPASGPAPRAFHGRNTFWYPGLGIQQSLAWFPCTRAAAPGNFVYRWGCAGSGNVYLLAHAGGKFRALYNAYNVGGLSPGQLAVYADAGGGVHYYRLAWWKTARPTTAAAWAWAPQSRSSLTLQTCVGAHSELRLFVRFVEVAAP